MAMQTRQELRQQILEAFKLEELEVLCSDLGVDPESIPGRANAKPYYVDQLIGYLQVRGQMSDFLKALSDARPNIDWTYSPPSDQSTLAKKKSMTKTVLIAVIVAIVAVSLTSVLLLRTAPIVRLGSQAATGLVKVGESQPLPNVARARVASIKVEYGCVVLLSHPERDDDQLRICEDTPVLPEAWQTKTLRIGVDCASRALSTIHMIVYASPDYEDKTWEYQFSC